jgi:hypothetical protein
VRRLLALAAEKPERLLNAPDQIIDDFVCSALRGEIPQWRSLNSCITPEVFIERCQHHGVASLLYHGIKDSDAWWSWPDSVRASLEQRSKAGVAQELLRGHCLQRLVQAFSSRGVGFLLSKGEALAQTHYPVAGTRTRGDSDLFIDPCDIAGAKQAVLDAGFAIVSPIYKTHQFTVRRSMEGADAIEFDIHWRLLNAPRYARSISFSEAWADSIALPRMSCVRTLSARHSLMLACMHRVGSEWHDQNRLIWIYDIHLLVSRMTSAELMLFANCAVERNVHTACYQGLSLAQKCFATEFPGELLPFLNMPQSIRRLAHSNLWLLIADWKELPTAVDRCALLRELCFPSPQLLLRRYHKTNQMWLPVLYLRQIFGGIVKRLTLH